MIGAVMVLYNPDFRRLEEGLKGLVKQVDKVIMVDNSELDNSGKLSRWICDKVDYLPLKENSGIAHAQNIGIRYLKKHGYEFVIFSDQDSVCSDGLVDKLMRSYQSISKNHSVAAVGPMPVNKKSGIRYFFEGNIIDRHNENNLEFYNVNYVISSFSLIKLETYEKVGLLNESLFIDGVDCGWCFRARYYFGLNSYILPNLTIDHELGKSTWFMGMHINLSSPFRLYYQFRNLLWEAREDYAPQFWKKRNLRKLPLKIVSYPIIGKEHLKYLSSVYRGLRDGFFRKYRMGIPQYSGSKPNIDLYGDFNNWIDWYQQQPLTQQFKYTILSFKGLFCEMTVPQESFDSINAPLRLFVFNGEVEAICSVNDNCLNIVKNPTILPKDIINSIKEKFSDTLFVSLDLQLNENILKITDITCYPGIGAYDYTSAIVNDTLSKFFLKAYKVRINT